MKTDEDRGKGNGRAAGGAAIVAAATLVLWACGVRNGGTDAPASPAEAAPVAAAGACCAGFGDRNGAAGDGCETKLAEDLANCGACGNACVADPRALPVCVDGRCRYACRVGRAECDGEPATVCETETLRDPCHCSGCGRACAPGQFCVAGLCQGHQDPLVQLGPPAPHACPPQ